ncbi:MAG: hypothetical protein ACRDCG_00300 [Mycoplasmoidaceae bacterium]
MAYFLALLIIGLYFLIDIFCYITKKNFPKATFIFCGLAFIQLILGPLTFFKISLSIYQPIAITATIAILFFGFLWIFYYFFASRLKFIDKKFIKDFSSDEYIFIKKDFLISRSLSAILIIIIFIVQFFIGYYDNDSTYYVSIGSNFANNGVYSANGIKGDVISPYYLFTTSYFWYGVILKTKIQLGFTLVSRIFYLFIIFSLAGLIIDNIKINNEKQKLFIIISLLLFIPILFFLELRIVAQGNLIIQSVGVLVIFFSIYYSKKISSFQLLIPFGMAFFSSTGILIGIVSTISTLLYWFFRNDGLKVIQYIPYLILIILISGMIFSGFSINFYNNDNKIILLSLYYAAIAFLIIHFFVYRFFHNKNNFKAINLIKRFDEFNKVIIFVILLAALPLLSIIFWWIIPALQEKYGGYHFQLTLVPVLISFFLIIYTIKVWHKEKRMNKLSFLFIIFWSINIIFKIILSLPFSFLENYNNNASSWRIIFTFIGQSQFEIFIFFWIGVIKFSKYKDIQKLFFFKIHITSILCSLFLSISIILLPIITIGSELIFNKEISKSIYYFNNKELDYLKSINKRDFSQSYISTIPVNSYLDGYVNITKELGYGSWWTINSGLCNTNKNTPKIDGKDFYDRLSSLEIKIDSITNKSITKVDYLFFAPYGDIYSYIKNKDIISNYQLTFEDSGMIVYYKK